MLETRENTHHQRNKRRHKSATDAARKAPSMKPAPHPMRRATRHPRCQPRAPRSVGGYAKGAPQQGDAPTHADRMRALSAASVKRHSSRLQISNIRTLTTICHAASSPIRHALAQEKLTNDIQNPINHCISPHPSTNPAPPDGARARKTRTHPTRGAHATLTNVTIAHKPPHTQPHQRRQHGEIRHSKGKGHAPEHVRRARPQMRHPHLAGHYKPTIAQ